MKHRQEELYDIKEDPRELDNLIAEMPKRAKEMERKLMERLPNKKWVLSNDEPMKVDRDTKESLNALGYISDND